MSEIIVLDTHIWIWLINGNFDRFPSQWLGQFESASSLGVSPVSCYEIALASQRGRLNLSKGMAEWFRIALAPAGIELLPLNAEVACQAVNLSSIHKDPFDRIIIATALVYQGQLASVDRQFSRYPELTDYLMR
ncbi:MAG: type II toxin-antitoxin system VapC family toxin [Arthrospira sp. SH-MAG29]|nr:PIN domain-containing protein [Arthrospira sp. SH-MAG29]MBS0017050.1 type II toxin-antitoxin system VapC family toxin [Arthrospira sp. SH-MAG29]